MKSLRTVLTMTALAVMLAPHPVPASTAPGAKPHRHRPHRSALRRRVGAPEGLRPGRGMVIPPPRGRRVSGAVIVPPDKTHFPGGKVVPPAGQR